MGVLKWLGGKIFKSAGKLKDIQEAVTATKAFFIMFREMERKYRSMNIPEDVSLLITQGKVVADEWEDVF